jgi:hypothetical protein
MCASLVKEKPGRSGGASEFGLRDAPMQHFERAKHQLCRIWGALLGCIGRSHVMSFFHGVPLDLRRVETAGMVAARFKRRPAVPWVMMDEGILP